MAKEKVFVLVPSGELIHADFHRSFLDLMMSAISAGYQLAYKNVKGSLIQNSRNLLVKAALEADFDYALFLDSDMMFPRDIIPCMLTTMKERNLDILCATYAARVNPYNINGTPLEQTKTGEFHTGIFELSDAPTGCLMVKTSVFKELSSRGYNCYFASPPNHATGAAKGEDYFFSELARSQGFRLWCDGDISRLITHIGLDYINIGRYNAKEHKQLMAAGIITEEIQKCYEMESPPRIEDVYGRDKVYGADSKIKAAA